MHLESLRYFYEVSRCLNITQSAHQMNISQQRLSGHIQRLEEYYGIPLFVRKPKLQLTHAGEILVKYAEQMLEIDRDLHAIFSDLRQEQTGRIRLGITSSRAQISLPSIMSQFCRKYPSIQLELINGTTAESIERMQNNEIDVMIGVDNCETNQTDVTTLMTEQVYILIPENILQNVYGTDFSRREDAHINGVHLEDFASQPFILPSAETHLRKIVDRLFEQLCLVPKVICESGNSQIQSQLASSGFGICFLPQMMISSKVAPAYLPENSKEQTYPICLSDVSYQIILGLPKNRYIPQYIKEFKNIAIDVFSNFTT